MITGKISKYREYGKQKLSSAGEFLMSKETSRHTLVLSCCVGVYVAISPFIFLHTIMIFTFGWICSLNIPIMLAVSWFINNPWTMVPIYAFDCIVGDWIFMFLGIDSMQYNPSWMNGLNAWLSSYIGYSGVSFWAFIVGGNLLAILLSVILYPVFSYCFARMRH